MNERRGTKGLELWCRKMTEGYPGVKIDNMTTSWRDGLAFCAIIHHFRPDLMDFSKLSKDDIYHNNELAFRIAEQYLGIPALLEPEDMVEYSVPDRLSILTYLSQFYQAFAVREGSSPARIATKRPQSSTDHGIVSPASTSPPTKVAVTGAGKLRREPCTKCGLPVFIAERLNVGKSLFHRTCFRCARCNSQLTLANYYETESNEFCCEICPDEEKVMSKASAQKAVLLRSMSDEDKSASLKIVSNEPDEFSTMFESALENAGIEKVQTLTREFKSARTNFFQSQIESNDSRNDDKEEGSSGTDDKEAEPPDLPKSQPSSNIVSVQPLTKYDSGFPSKDVSVKSSFSHDVESQNVVTKDASESFVKARMRLFEKEKFTDLKSDVHSKPVPLAPFASIPISIKYVHSSSEDTGDTQHRGHDDSDSNYGKMSPEKPFTNTISIKVNKKDNNVDEQQSKDSQHISEGNDESIITISDSSLNKSLIVDREDNKVDEQQSKDVQPSTEGNDESVITISDSSLDENTSSLSKVDEALGVINSTISSLPDSSHQSMHSKTDPRVSSQNDVSIPDSLNQNNDHNSGAFISLKSDSPVKTEYEQKEVIDNRENLFKTEAEETVETVNYNVQDTSKYASGNIRTVVETVNPITENLVDNQSTVLLNMGQDTIRYAATEHSTSEFKSRSDSPVTMMESVNNNVKNTADFKSASSSPVIAKKLSESKFENQITDTVNYNISVPIREPKSKIKDTSIRILEKKKSYPEDLNPFDEDEASPPKTSLNPFGSEDDEEEEVVPLVKPRPKPRKILDASECREIWTSPPKQGKITRISINPFADDDDDDETKPPVPVTRKKKISAPKISLNPFSSDDDEESLEARINKPIPAPRTPRASRRLSELKPKEPSSLLGANNNFGSNSSISSGSYYGSSRKKRPAPKPPIPVFMDDSNASSLASTPSHSVQHSPKSTPKYRKTKRAPPPPIVTSTPIQGEKAEENNNGDTKKSQSEVETEKNLKDEVNRNSQNLKNQHLIEDSNILSVPNKSTYGQWKRKKGQAPPKPIPKKRTLNCLPMAEIRKELEYIEIQQQGLERQGVRLEQIIREKCEGNGSNSTPSTDDDIPIEVEDLILQLFELVNEKNELFRKQTELMYLRRQQRLEEEHADVEYQIRCLMMQPEANKTDSDKAHEEELIKRLVDIVERRNEIVECLEMDRVREAEEDNSISNHINLFTLNRETVEKSKSEIEKPKKLKGKDKEKEKKDKDKKKEKKSKNKPRDKIDIDKDVDETEVLNTIERKKKKKFNLF